MKCANAVDTKPDRVSEKNPTTRSTYTNFDGNERMFWLATGVGGTDGTANWKNGVARYKMFPSGMCCIIVFDILHMN